MSEPQPQLPQENTESSHTEEEITNNDDSAVTTESAQAQELEESEKTVDDETSPDATESNENENQEEISPESAAPNDKEEDQGDNDSSTPNENAEQNSENEAETTAVEDEAQQPAHQEDDPEQELANISVSPRAEENEDQDYTVAPQDSSPFAGQDDTNESTLNISLDVDSHELTAETPTITNKDSLSEEEELRQRYLKVYKLAREKNHQLQLQKQQVEDRLAHYFKTAKKPQEFKEKTLSSNAEERYRKLVESHREKRIELNRARKKNAAQLKDLLAKLQNKQSAASKLQTSYRDYKMGVAGKAENSRTGKPIPNSKIEELSAQEIRKDEEVRAIRTKYIYLSNQKEALEKSIKQKEFSDGLHLIDFEQFKMENATLNEKIEEKNESLQKSRLKARSTVHILTHVNEKLQFVQTEDIEMKQRLADLEKELSSTKKVLASLKDTRDHYKNQNVRMRDSNPLIGNDQLLVDYESRKQELEDLRYKLKHLRNLHSENERKTERTKRQINSTLRRQEQQGPQGRFLPNIHA